jgi:hypothetical protein
MKPVLSIILSVFLFASFTSRPSVQFESVIGAGQMPAITKDKSGSLHVVFGKGDSILYACSKNGGQNFSAPALVAVLHELSASHTRGPQIATLESGLMITACNGAGNIFSYSKTGSGKWQTQGRVNDADTVAKENLMALSADGSNAYAVWLDLRNGHNQLFGARSTDAGKTWSKNVLVYASPDSTVCECCKPSVAIKGKQVYVMFRNWLNGSRDLFVIHSSDGGYTFEGSQKLGYGHWILNGCPMDGGAFVLNEKGIPQTVWHRKGEIFTCEPGREEIAIGKGRGCTIELIHGKPVYAWLENKNIVILTPQGSRINIGRGESLQIKAIDDKHVLCIWENSRKIYSAVVEV